MTRPDAVGHGYGPAEPLHPLDPPDRPSPRAASTDDWGVSLAIGYALH